MRAAALAVLLAACASSESVRRDQAEVSMTVLAEVFTEWFADEVDKAVALAPDERDKRLQALEMIEAQYKYVEWEFDRANSRNPDEVFTILRQACRLMREVGVREERLAHACGS